MGINPFDVPGFVNPDLEKYKVEPCRTSIRVMDSYDLFEPGALDRIKQQVALAIARELMAKDLVKLVGTKVNNSLCTKELTFEFKALIKEP